MKNIVSIIQDILKFKKILYVNCWFAFNNVNFQVNTIL